MRRNDNEAVQRIGSGMRAFVECAHRSPIVEARATRTHACPVEQAYVHTILHKFRICDLFMQNDDDESVSDKRTQSGICFHDTFLRGSEFFNYPMESSFT